MYFEDLEICRYHEGRLDGASWAVPLRSIGWLEHPKPFVTGEVPAGIVPKLTRLAALAEEHFPLYQFRGEHECDICLAEGKARVYIGQGVDLIIPGSLEVFAAPAGVVHYISEHSYRPPPAFLEAVRTCPDCGSEPYWEALRRANDGQEPPMENQDEFVRGLRESVEINDRFERALGVPLKQATRAQVLAAARVTWPELSFSDDCPAVDLPHRCGHVVFDTEGRVVDLWF